MPKRIVKHFWNYKFFRFLIIGVINTVFGYGVFAFLIYIGLHYTLAVLLGTIMGILFNFKTLGKFVFRNCKNRLIFRFVTVYFVTYWLNVFLISVFKDIVEGNMYFAGFLATIPVSVLAFLLNKYFVFDLNNGKEYD